MKIKLSPEEAFDLKTKLEREDLNDGIPSSIQSTKLLLIDDDDAREFLKKIELCPNGQNNYFIKANTYDEVEKMLIEFENADQASTIKLKEYRPSSPNERFDKKWSAEFSQQIGNKLYLVTHDLKNVFFIEHAVLGNLLCIYINSKGMITFIDSNFDSATVNVATFNQSSALIEKIRNILKLKTPSVMEYSQFRHSIHQNSVVKELVASERIVSKKYTKPVAKKIINERFDPARTKLVSQRQAVLSSYNKKDYLLTYGANPCVILSFYDPVTQTGYLAHIDAGSTYLSIKENLNQFLSKVPDKSKIEIRAFSGGEDKMTLLKIVTAVEQNGLDSRLLEVCPKSIESLALSLKDGTVYEIANINLLDPINADDQNSPKDIYTELRLTIE